MLWLSERSETAQSTNVGVGGPLQEVFLVVCVDRGVSREQIRSVSERASFARAFAVIPFGDEPIPTRHINAVRERERDGDKRQRDDCRKYHGTDAVYSIFCTTGGGGGGG